MEEEFHQLQGDGEPHEQQLPDVQAMPLQPPVFGSTSPASHV